ncbi:MAG: hypothetical protein IPG50_18365 [Myxococcales bacterium]|nr:hypothetical protein [Myxococcales bacterium]
MFLDLAARMATRHAGPGSWLAAGTATLLALLHCQAEATPPEGPCSAEPMAGFRPPEGGRLEFIPGEAKAFRYDEARQCVVPVSAPLPGVCMHNAGTGGSFGTMCLVSPAGTLYYVQCATDSVPVGAGWTAAGAIGGPVVNNIRSEDAARCVAARQVITEVTVDAGHGLVVGPLCGPDAGGS